MFDSTKIVTGPSGIPVGDKAVSASFFARYFSAFIASGVYGSDDEFLVASKDARTLCVRPGQAMLEGYFCFDDEESSYPLQSAYQTDTGKTVVLRLDRIKGEIGLLWLDGLTVMPLRNDNYYDLILANVEIPAGTTSTAQVRITDLRNVERTCGRAKLRIGT
jgi:hypothetical protein